jgi:nucleoporin p58/p45
LAEQTAHKMHWYRDAVEQVERTLAAILGSAQSQSHAMTPQAIGMTLQSQHATFVGLAAKVSSVHAELESVKRLYTQLWRARTGSVRDPFEERGVGDVGLEGM